MHDAGSRVKERRNTIFPPVCSEVFPEGVPSPTLTNCKRLKQQPPKHVTREAKA